MVPAAIRNGQIHRSALLVGVLVWVQALQSYAQQHGGLVAVVVGAVGFTGGLVALGCVFEQLSQSRPDAQANV